MTGGDHDAFVRIQHAYEVLSDEGKRTRYDTTGEEEAPKQPHIYEVLSQIFLNIVQHYTDVEHTDLVKILKKELKSQQTNVRNSLCAIYAEAEKWRQISRRANAPLIKELARQRRLNNIKTYLVSRQSRQLIKLALETVKDWSYTVDPKKQPNIEPWVQINPFYQGYGQTGGI